LIEIYRTTIDQNTSIKARKTIDWTRKINWLEFFQ